MLEKNNEIQIDATGNEGTDRSGTIFNIKDLYESMPQLFNRGTGTHDSSAASPSGADNSNAPSTAPTDIKTLNFSNPIYPEEISYAKESDQGFNSKRAESPDRTNEIAKSDTVDKTALIESATTIMIDYLKYGELTQAEATAEGLGSYEETEAKMVKAVEDAMNQGVPLSEIIKRINETDPKKYPTLFAIDEIGARALPIPATTMSPLECKQHGVPEGTKKYGFDCDATGNETNGASKARFEIRNPNTGKKHFGLTFAGQR